MGRHTFEGGGREGSHSDSMSETEEGGRAAWYGCGNPNQVRRVSGQSGLARAAGAQTGCEEFK